MIQEHWINKMRFLFWGCLMLGFIISAETLAQNDELLTPPGVTGKALKIHRDILKGVPLYDDPALHKYANDLARKIGGVSKHPNVTYRVFILDSEGVNAFTPGYGLIYFYRGLISLLTTEGQFAAVIAHEIGHNVGRHIGRAKTKRAIGNVGEVVASVLAGNSGVGNAIAIANQEREKAYSRDLELEADAYAAKYLFATGYEPTEMISSLSVLKDNALLLDKIQGSNNSHYHGIFLSHPSSDKRLKELVDQAGVLPPGEAFKGRAEMRERLEGMVFGPNFNANKRPDQDRYMNKSLGITFVYPNTWSKEVKGDKIVMKDAEKTVQLKITIEKTKDKSLSSQQKLEAKYPDGLTKVESLNPKATKDLGSIARLGQKRVAAISVGRNTYYFSGIARNNKLTADQDKVFVEIVASFRRVGKRDLSKNEVKRLTFKRLELGETFATLAQDARLGKYTEGYLRVMNGYYPRGEPEPGTYVKIIAPPSPAQEDNSVP